MGKLTSASSMSALVVVVAEVGDGAAQALAPVDGGVVAEQLLVRAKSGPPRSLGCRRGEGGRRSARARRRGRSHRMTHRVRLSEIALPARHVHDLTFDVGGALGGGEVGLHGVGHIGEVAGLAAVAVNGGAIAFKQDVDELRDHRCIRPIGILARPEDVEVAQCRPWGGRRRRRKTLRYCSQVTFPTAYGLSGRGGMSSCLGNTSVSPK